MMLTGDAFQFIQSRSAEEVMLSLKDWLCDQRGLFAVGFIIMAVHSHLVDLTLLAADVMIVSLNCWVSVTVPSVSFLQPW